VESLIRGVVTFLVWALANAVYVDMRRKGARGFARLVAFCVGLPLSLVSLILIRREHHHLAPPPDDHESLLREVRVDRERREERLEP